jgi:hypothetical protein
VIVIIVVALAVFFIMRGTKGGGDVPPGGVGHPGPFSPGGAATGKGGGMPAQAAKQKNPFHP